MGEIFDLPIIQKKAILVDCLVDNALAEEHCDTVATAQDAVLFTKSVLPKFVDQESVPDWDELVYEVASKLSLFCISDTPEEGSRLSKAYASRPVDRQSIAPYIVVSNNTIAVRVPSYDTANTGQEDNLGKILRWAVSILGISNPIVKIAKDKELGKDINLPSKIERFLDNSMAAMTLAPSESSDRFEFLTGLKANQVEMIAALRLLRRYGHCLKRSRTLGKLSKEKKTKVSPVSIEDLKKILNARAGMFDHGVPPFLIGIVKGVLNELTKYKSTRFPGQWIHSLRSANKTKSNIGVLYKMGYELRVINPVKLLSVVKTAVQPRDNYVPKQMKRSGEKPNPNDAVELVSLSDKTRPEGTTFREFRLGALLLLPLIDPKDKESPKGQISRDPLTMRNKIAQDFYQENRDVVDALNLAYATQASIGQKTAKSTPLGFKSARGRAIRRSANRTYKDAAGTEYQRIKEIPEHIRNFLCSLFLFKWKEDGPSEEQQAEDHAIEDAGDDSSLSDVPSDEEEEDIEPSAALDVPQTPGKKRDLTSPGSKGEAHKKAKTIAPLE
jgi:hypothetical protein